MRSDTPILLKNSAYFSLAVVSTLKNKEDRLIQVNPKLCTLKLDEGTKIYVGLTCHEAEMDEQWSFVFKKSNQRWLLYAVDHATNTVLAYVFGRRKDEVGKKNTQKIERKSLNFRTWIKRLARKTICFSKCEKMHDIVIGLLINKLEFGVNIHAK